MTPNADDPQHSRPRSEDAEDQFFDASDGPVDLPAAPVAPHTVTTGIHFNDLINEGTVFDTDHVPTRAEREMREDAADQEAVDEGEPGSGPTGRRPPAPTTTGEEDENQRWWTQEELAAHLSRESKVTPMTGIPDGEERSAFEIRKSLMQVIYSDEDGRPLVWKHQQHPGYGKQVTEDSSVEYDVEAYSEDNDEPFDSSKILNRTYHSRLNGDAIVPGLFIALTSMSVGEKAQFIVQYELGFGKMGCPPRIPPESDIFYDIEVRKVLEEGTIADFIHKTVEQQSTLPFDQLLEMADSERKSGNAYFTDGRKKQAGIRYKRAIKVLEDRALESGEEERRAQEILLKLYCNTANTSLHLNRPYVAMHYCNKALAIDKDNVKALYHYGKAKIDVGDYEDAVRYLIRARSLKPHNTDVSRELARLNRRLAEDSASSRLLETRMAQIFVNAKPDEK